MAGRPLVPRRRSRRQAWPFSALGQGGPGWSRARGRRAGQPSRGSAAAAQASCVLALGRLPSPGPCSSAGRPTAAPDKVLPPYRWRAEGQADFPSGALPGSRAPSFQRAASHAGSPALSGSPPPPACAPERGKLICPVLPAEMLPHRPDGSRQRLQRPPPRIGRGGGGGVEALCGFTMCMCVNCYYMHRYYSMGMLMLKLEFAVVKESD